MGESRDSSGLILGLIIGALIALALLSRNNIQTASTPAPVQQQSQQLTWKPMDIPRVDDIKPLPIQQIIQIQQDHRLTHVMSELERTNSQLEQTASKLQELQNATSKLHELENSVSKLQTQNEQYISQNQATIQPETISQLEQTTSKLQETVSKLEQNSNVHLETTSKLQETVSRLEHDRNKLLTQIVSATEEPQLVQISQMPKQSQLTQLSQQQEQQPQPIHTQQIYKNSEKWAIKRGPDGRIRSLEIARDVEKKN